MSHGKSPAAATRPALKLTQVVHTLDAEEIERRPLEWRLIRRLFGYARPYRDTCIALALLTTLRSLQLPLLVWVIAAVIGARAVAHSDADESRLAFRLTSAEIASTLTLAIQHEEDLVVAPSSRRTSVPPCARTSSSSCTSRSSGCPDGASRAWRHWSAGAIPSWG